MLHKPGDKLQTSDASPSLLNPPPTGWAGSPPHRAHPSIPVFCLAKHCITSTHFESSGYPASPWLATAKKTLSPGTPLRLFAQQTSVLVWQSRTSVGLARTFRSAVPFPMFPPISATSGPTSSAAVCSPKVSPALAVANTSVGLAHASKQQGPATLPVHVGAVLCCGTLQQHCQQQH
jgi:hypothetical protein